MAVTWDFILISSCFILNINEKREEKIGIEKMLSIDDWAWTNQREVQGFLDMERRLEEGKIIVIYIESNKWKNVGLYIEKEEEEYIYTLWFNTEGIPELDSSKINNSNIKYYKRAYSVLEELIVKYNINFRIIAIGVESDVSYCDNLKKMISDSYNVVVWIINKNEKFKEPILNYKKRVEDAMNAIVYENILLN